VGIKIIQIGAGIRGRHWIEFVKNHPDVDCIAIVEPDAASLEKAKGLLPASDCRFFQDIGEALKSVKADAALVVSPSATHADVSIHCLDAGLTVMVEKPLAVTVEEGRRVLERHVPLAAGDRC
jgi:predicted dehydrogenase